MKVKKNTIIFVLLFLVVGLSGGLVYSNFLMDPYPPEAYVKIPDPVTGYCVRTNDLLWDWETRQYLIAMNGQPIQPRCYVTQERTS